MIGQQGWVVSFTVKGTGQEDLQRKILERLHTFWPPEDTSGWRIDVDAYPNEQVADGGGTVDIVTSWIAEVKAQRVLVASATDHRAVDGQGKPVDDGVTAVTT